MKTTTVLKRATLHDFVMAFDCEDGLPEILYTCAKALIGDMLGEEAREKFVCHIDATDGKFFLPAGNGMAVWNAILKEAMYKPEEF